MAKPAEPEDKENVYEQKIKEEDKRRARQIQEEKQMIKMGYILGFMILLPMAAMMGFIFFKSKNFEKIQSERDKEEIRQKALRESVPKIKLKRLHF